ncbi:MAG TPA: EcsC family protein [Burkholderiaceae bacterium]
MSMHAADVHALSDAIRAIERPGVGARLANLVGSPIERLVGLLPQRASSVISAAARKAIHASLNVSLRTLATNDALAPGAPPPASNGWHKVASAASGAVGGAFGLAALAVELPVSTTIMMRSIADVARSEGADLADRQTQLECVMVLALGGNAGSDDAAEVGYFAVREAMTRAVSSAAAHLARHGLAKEGAPALVRLITLIAEHYSVNVTEKAAAQMVPLIGAVGGATINTIFIDHFQAVARGHFTVRRLERKYGEATVRDKYRELAAALD